MEEGKLYKRLHELRKEYAEKAAHERDAGRESRELYFLGKMTGVEQAKQALNEELNK